MLAAAGRREATAAASTTSAAQIRKLTLKPQTAAA